VVSQTALIFGASGGLANAIAKSLLVRGWKVDLVSRESRRSQIEERFFDSITAGVLRVFTVANSYTEFVATQPYQAYLFTQALFAPKLLVETVDGRIGEEIAVGLTDPIILTRSLLVAHPPAPTERRDFAFIGSTSAYAGFKKTAAYCAVKHGLLGFIRAMNDEYVDTETRFWLFSMGTMNTEMGALLIEQDPSSFLLPEDVACRIVDSLATETNLFEPEIIMRRRNIRFKTK
jgi:NAD(P)-dependent dehydrogenase (short-subunit alcohol dehydrogenase family)